MSTERIDRLEERLAWLQRHVAEQDKAMLEMAGQIDRLKAETLRLRSRADVGFADGGSSGGSRDVGGDGFSGGAADANERPPHY